MEDTPINNNLSRRSLLKGIAKAGALLVVAPTIWIPRAHAGAQACTKGEKLLSMYNTHTGESLNRCAYWIDGKFNPEVIKDFRKFFRDHRTDEEHDLDPDLLDLIHKISTELDTSEAVHLISGYRSPQTNALLRKRSHGVARNSQHLNGKAADILVPGRSLKQIQMVAKKLEVGGVGRYSRYVHVDTGPVRYWGKA